MESSESVQNQLRQIVETVDAANALTAPLTRSIEHLLTLGAAAVETDEASVIVRDAAGENLYFLAAIGAVAERLRGLRIPLDAGVAGFVFSSGQPVAIADAAQDAAFYGEVDKQTGYSTQTILATPLRFEGEIIGVLEFVNRFGEPPFRSFTPEEMDKAALYAEAIASLVDAHESAALIEKLSVKILESSESNDLREWLKSVRAAPEHREMLALALLVRDIASRGESERRLCAEILTAVARFEREESPYGKLDF